MATIKDMIDGQSQASAMAQELALGELDRLIEKAQRARGLVLSGEVTTADLGLVKHAVNAGLYVYAMVSAAEVSDALTEATEG